MKRRESIPYAAIAKLYIAGKTMVEIATKTGLTNRGKDSSHYIRALLTRMRQAGFADARTGKRIRLDGEKLVPMTVKKATGKTKVAKPKAKKTATAKPHRLTPVGLPPAETKKKEMANA